MQGSACGAKRSTDKCGHRMDLLLEQEAIGDVLSLTQGKLQFREHSAPQSCSISLIVIQASLFRLAEEDPQSFPVCFCQNLQSRLHIYYKRACMSCQLKVCESPA